MAAYVIVGFNPKNAERLQAYSSEAAPIIAKFKGEFLVKGELRQLGGEYSYRVQAVIMFPTRDLAESWYNSPAYQALIPLRDQGMESHFQVVGE